MIRRLAVGEPAPWFHAAAIDGNPNYAFDTVGGRWILMLFIGSARGDIAQALLSLVEENRDLFDDQGACFFGVTMDPEDAAQGRIAQQLPGIRWFLDYDRAVSTMYGAAGDTEGSAPHWLLIDPMMRVHGSASLPAGRQLLSALRQLKSVQRSIPAPVLVVPNVLTSDMCRRLVALYEEQGGQRSGFMREEDGITVTKFDDNHKRRSDCAIADEALISLLRRRLFHVLRPMVERAFQFEPTRIERWIVACYDSRDKGCFRPHRDNTTKGTAHRRFAVTINLNVDGYEGGDLRFPEFGPQAYRAPTGGALVFSCSLLHEALPVTWGKRYAFLPFLYDDDDALARERNLENVAPELRNYRIQLPQEV